MSEVRDFTNIKPENVRLVTAPLKIEFIKEFFENKELFFIVDYKNSQLKGNMFLTYLANLDLPSEIIFKDCSQEEKFELIKIYMTSRNINSSEMLRLNTADIILTYKGINTQEMFQNGIFTTAEKNEFIAQNKDLLNRWDQFISSSFVYLITLFPEMAELMNIKSQVPEETDPNYVGLNIVNLFSLPAFLEHFMTRPLHPELKYFKPQFEEYMFRGKNFYYYYKSTSNTFLGLLGGLHRGDFTTSELANFLKARAQSESSL